MSLDMTLFIRFIQIYKFTTFKLDLTATTTTTTKN